MKGTFERILDLLTSFSVICVCVGLQHYKYSKYAMIGGKSYFFVCPLGVYWFDVTVHGAVS